MRHARQRDLWWRTPQCKHSGSHDESPNFAKARKAPLPTGAAGDPAGRQVLRLPSTALGPHSVTIGDDVTVIMRGDIGLGCRWSVQRLG